MRHILSTLFVAVLFGCAVTGATDTFIVNGRIYKLDAAQMEQLRRSWVDSSVAQRSQLSPGDRQWVLDFLAIAARTICERPRLVRIKTMPIPMEVLGPGKKLSRAQKFHEIWTVDACGTVFERRIIDYPYGVLGDTVAVVSLSDGRDEKPSLK